MKRILVKISGELLGGENQNFNHANITRIVKLIGALQNNRENQVYVVLGGGNIARGRELSLFNFPNGRADHVGMLSTVSNALIFKLVCDTVEAKSHVMAPFAAPDLQIHPYESDKAVWWARKGHIMIFGGGLGRCGFTTDMTAVSRAYEVGADIVVKLTEVGGLFTADPKVDSTAKLISKISAREVIKNEYEVMDGEAFIFAKKNKIPIKIMKLEDLSFENIYDDSIGSIITPD